MIYVDLSVHSGKGQNMGNKSLNPFLSLLSVSRISNIQWTLALIFQKRAAWLDAISLWAECGNQMQWCVKTRSSNSPLTEG